MRKKRPVLWFFGALHEDTPDLEREKYRNQVEKITFFSNFLFKKVNKMISHPSLNSPPDREECLRCACEHFKHFGTL